MKNIKNDFMRKGVGFRYKAGRFPYHVFYLSEDEESQFSVIVFADDSQGAVSTIAGLIAFINESGGDARELSDALTSDNFFVNKLQIDALIPVELELNPAETLLQDDGHKTGEQLMADVSENTSPEANKTSDSIVESNVKDGENSSPGLKDATDGANNQDSQETKETVGELNGGLKAGIFANQAPDPNQDDLNKAGDQDSTINS